MRNRQKNLVLWTIVATGITSVATQLVSIREFLSIFSGNEYIIALIVFIWLILGGLGTLASHWPGRWLKGNISHLAKLSLLLIFLSPVQIMAIRHLQGLIFLPGASLGFYSTLLYILACTAPYAFLVGFLLPYSLFVIRSKQRDYPGTPIYLTDNIGDVLGGALFSFVLIHIFSPMQAVMIANLPLLTICFLLGREQRKPFFRVCLACGLAFFPLILGVILEVPSLNILHQGKLVGYKDSLYQRITVYRQNSQYTLFTDGSPGGSSANIYSAEEKVHFPLAQIKAEHPKILLLSAESGMIREIKKYQPQRIDYLELDPALSRIQIQTGLLQDVPVLKCLHQDARKYLQDSQERYQVILLAHSEPKTFKTNRYFTREFFNLAKKHLKPGGIFSFSVKGFENYPTPAEEQKIASLRLTAKEVFAQQLLLPGRNLHFLLSDKKLSQDIPGLLKQKGIETSYISSFFYGNITKERIEYVQNLPLKGAEPNLDLDPSLMQNMFRQWFSMHAQSAKAFFIALLALLCLYLLCISKEEFVLASTGFTSMGAEILTIFTLQIFFGYVYHYIGLIVTVFLAGLLPGALLGDWLKSRGLKLLKLTDLGLAILLAGFVILLEHAGQELPLPFFFLFGLSAALLCGLQFPVALNIQGDSNSAVSRVFSADLLGAALGALLPSTVLIPSLGIFWTGLSIAGIKIVSFVICNIGLRKNKVNKFR